MILPFVSPVICAAQYITQPLKMLRATPILRQCCKAIFIYLSCGALLHHGGRCAFATGYPSYQSLRTFGFLAIVFPLFQFKRETALARDYDTRAEQPTVSGRSRPVGSVLAVLHKNCLAQHTSCPTVSLFAPIVPPPVMIHFISLILYFFIS